MKTKISLVEKLLYSPVVLNDLYEDPGLYLFNKTLVIPYVEIKHLLKKPDGKAVQCVFIGVYLVQILVVRYKMLVITTYIMKTEETFLFKWFTQ